MFMYTYIRYTCTYKYIPTNIYINMYVLLSIRSECPKILSTVILQRIVQTQNLIKCMSVSEVVPFLSISFTPEQLKVIHPLLFFSLNISFHS